ncbi:MAG TPA: FAD-binding oxidoreductase [Vicinamibacterales bacterium]|nr:FAD-binding oxidoreductase [Vicinamibacterales bacterium]
MILPILSVRRATPATRILRLGLDAPFAYAAGQAAELGPVGTSALAPYSIACAPEDTARDGCIEFLVKLDAAGRWGEHFEKPRRGQRLRVRGPIGGFTFPAAPRVRRFLFIAGGTGIAPIRSMIRHARAAVPAAVVRLLYSARTPLDFAYRRELCGMARRGEIELTLTATRDVTERWRGARGRISSAQLAPLLDDRATLCFVCGPAAMVDDVPRMLAQLGVERSLIRIEEW